MSPHKNHKKVPSYCHKPIKPYWIFLVQKQVPLLSKWLTFDATVHPSVNLFEIKLMG